MLKFSAYVFHYHQPPDTYNVKLLFNHFLRRGRELLEKVRNGGRHGTTAPDVCALPRVTPSVVYTKGTPAVLWQKSAVAWRNIVSNYLARNPSRGFVGRFAKNYQSQRAFVSCRGTDGYRGLARKVAMFGFVGVAVSTNGKSQHVGLRDVGSDNIYSAIRDMFTVEAKQEPSELSVSISCLDDLQLGDIITSDGCAAFFAAEIRQHQPEPDTSFESMLMKDVEKLDEQHQQLTELMQAMQAQNMWLRQLAPLPCDVNNEDSSVPSVDSSALMVPASLDWSGNMDEVLCFIEKCFTEQSNTLSAITAAACRQNKQLRTACSQLQTSREVAKKKTFYSITDDDDDDEEGFVVISCDDSAGSWCEVTDHDVDPFPTMINFVDRQETLTVAGQRETQLTQLSKDKLSGNTSTVDNEAVVDSQDRETVKVMVRVRVISSDGGSANTDSILSAITQQLMHVNLVWWSHPTEPPDLHHRRCVVVPPHFNVVETFAGCVTNVANILAIGRHCDVLHGLSMTSDVHRDFAICTVMKPMKMTLAEFLSSHSIDIRQCYLLLLQIVEAVVHLTKYNISCSSLSSGGIFVELVNNEPHLVVADFGPVLRDEVDTWHTEESFSSPGYTQSSLFSLSVLACEIFNACSQQLSPVAASQILTAVRQESDAVNFPVSELAVVGKLMKYLLRSDQHVRLNTVANVLHMLLWAPQHLIIRPNSDTTLPDDITISWWLALLAAEVHCYQCTSHDVKSPLQPVVSNSLHCLFLSRVNARDIIDALTLLQICF